MQVSAGASSYLLPTCNLQVTHQLRFIPRTLVFRAVGNSPGFYPAFTADSAHMRRPFFRP